MNEWKKKCPIKRLKAYLLEQKIADEAGIEKIEKQADNDIKEALEYSNNSPEPKIEDIFEDVFAD